MKKTYKPISRTEQASQTFKRKTLNVGDALNVRHDDDNIENIDEYWNTAMSLIGNSTINSFNDTMVTEPSDTLFNIKEIRRSVKMFDIEKALEPIEMSEEANAEEKEEEDVNVKEGEKENVKEGEKENVRDNETSKNVRDNETSKNLRDNETSKNLRDNETSKNLRDNEVNKNANYERDGKGVNAINSKMEAENKTSNETNRKGPKNERSSKTQPEEIKEISFEINEGNLFEESQDSNGGNLSIELQESLQNSQQQDSLQQNSQQDSLQQNSQQDSLQQNSQQDSPQDSNETADGDSETGDQNSETKNEKFILENKEMGKVKTFSKSSRPAQNGKEKGREKSKGHNKESAQNDEIIVEEIQGMEKMNKIYPLVCSESINTAVMNLDFMAYIKDERSDKPFSIYVVKGKVKLRMGKYKEVIGKGNVTVIEKDVNYSMDCVSPNGAVLFLSYAI